MGDVMRMMLTIHDMVANLEDVVSLLDKRLRSLTGEFRELKRKVNKYLQHDDGDAN